ncbi:hypothetical protein ACIRRI_26490 [Streptomyces mirabilis]|uniref:hypothetical protein n=1 Tax=Streptomyces mirabilis TaxID=68239 RepID=UPI003807BC96
MEGRGPGGGVEVQGDGHGLQGLHHEFGGVAGDLSARRDLDAPGSLEGEPPQ